MTREHTILMLLAAGPASRGQLVQDTGWGIVETNAVVDQLLEDGQVVPFPGSGSKRHGSVVLCLPETRELALQHRGSARGEYIRGYMRTRRARTQGEWCRG